MTIASMWPQNASEYFNLFLCLVFSPIEVYTNSIFFNKYLLWALIVPDTITGGYQVGKT